MREIFQLNTLCFCGVTIDKDDEVILCQLIEQQRGLKRVDCREIPSSKFKYTGMGSFISLLIHLSSLEELTICTNDITIRAELLPHSNTNLKKLAISSELIQPLAPLLPNITSLIYLKIIGPVYVITDSDISVLITTVQSIHMLEVLKLGYEFISHTYYSTAYGFHPADVSELVKAAGNSQLKELQVDSGYYDYLPLHIQEQYSHLLKRISNESTRL